MVPSTTMESLHSAMSRALRLSSAALQPATNTANTAPATAQQFIVEGIFHQLVKLTFLTWIIAWLLSRASNSMVFNAPLAALLVGAVLWLSTHLDVRVREEAKPSRQRRTYTPKAKRPPPIAKGPCDRWRQAVNAPVVEGAWEKLLSNIIQEFVYDAFWRRVTCDSEFPAEIRNLLNHIFGQLAARIRKVDVKSVILRDVTDLLIETLELYRDTRDSVGAAELEKMTPLARDRALRLEMRAEGNLHPALYSNEHHYEVLKKLADGPLAVLMDPRDYDRPLIRSVVREIYMVSFLKPALQSLTPVTLNKLLVMVLEADYPELTATAEVAKLQGEQEFELKATTSAEEEAGRGSRSGKLLNSKQRYFHSTTDIPKLGATRLKAPSEVISASPDFAASRGTSRSVEARKGPLPLDSEKGVLSSKAEPSASKMPAVPEPLTTPSLTTSSSGSLSPSASAAGGSRGGVAGVPGGGAEASGGAHSPTAHGLAPAGAATATSSAVAAASSVRSAALPSASHPPAATPEEEARQRSARVVRKPGGRHRLERTVTEFSGQPYTKVVAAEINAERRSREYVVFNIRVNDDVHEWTVLRRFRNFEQLHKRLRNAYGFSGPLPPKRYFFSNNSWELVEQRREQLDKYLHIVLMDPMICFAEEVFDFLNPWSSAYALDTDVSLLNVVSSNLDNARHSVVKKVGGGNKGRPPASQRPAGGPLPLASDLGSRSFEEATVSSSLAAASSGSPTAARSLSPWASKSASTPGSASGSAPGSPRQSDISEAVRQPLAATSSKSAPIPRSSSDGALAKEPTQLVEQQVEHQAAVPSPNTRPALSPAQEAPSVSMPASLSGAAPEQSSSSVSSGPDFSLEEDSIGISRPLYLLVDAVFELQTHGFIWRQVTVVVKQMLSLVAGGTVDLFIAQKLHDICSTHTIARLLLRARNILWPGGVYFTVARAQDMLAQGLQPLPSPVPPGGYTRDSWLKLEAEVGPEEAQMAERLKDIFFKRASPTLVRVVGRSRYTNAMKDVYNILQSPTLMMQLGHGILEIGIFHLLPELIPLLEDIRSPEAAS